MRGMLSGMVEALENNEKTFLQIKNFMKKFMK